MPVHARLLFFPIEHINERTNQPKTPNTNSEPSELAFVDLVFSKHTKKACAWAHRRWCLARLWAGDRDGDGDDEAVIDAQEAHELDVTASIAERYPKNYYAWTHRWWAVETGAARRRRRRLRRRGGAEPWLEAQVAFGAAWVERHAWDMSAVSFLHQALAAWAKETEDEEQEDEKEGHTVVAVTARLCEMLDAGSRKLDQCPGHESLWYQRRGLLALWVEQQQRQQQRRDSIELSSIKPPSPPTASVDEGVPAFPYPPPLEEGGNDGMGARMGWELGMAAYYQGGQGPFHTEAGGGLLWEEAARRRQRRCAWAHARWVVELVQRHGGDDSMREWWAPRLGQAGLEEVRHAVGFVPPGYSKLVAQLAT